MAVGALAFAGCAAVSAEPGADTFLNEHSREAVRAAAAMRDLDTAVSRLPSSPTPRQLQALSAAAIKSRRDVALATDWGVSENGEEEDVGQAQTEVNEGAGRMLKAISAMRTYSRVPRPARLASLEADLAQARREWNSGISQIWYLARKPHPPTI